MDRRLSLPPLAASRSAKVVMAIEGAQFLVALAKVHNYCCTELNGSALKDHLV
jgi:hypothetical protein